MLLGFVVSYFGRQFTGDGAMNQFVASCLASGAVAHWLILRSVVQLTRG
jgi:hypothetical protein